MVNGLRYCSNIILIATVTTITSTKLISRGSKFVKNLKSILIKSRGGRMRINKKAGITPNELKAYVLLVASITFTKDLIPSYLKIVDRMIHIWNCSGPTFLFKGLKEVMRITVRVLAGIPPDPSKKIFVKLGYKGFPAIIPKDIIDGIYRKGYSDYLINIHKIIALLTILSIFRVLPTRVKPDYSTITDPFKGLSKTVAPELIQEALLRLDIGSSKRNLQPEFVGSLKAGPNGHISIMTTALDAISFLGGPSKILHYLNYNIQIFGIKGVIHCIWLLIVICSSLPYFILCYLLGSSFPVMGRLSVVYDQAGKARIVGITNSWIQSSLYPLHKYLFNILRRIPMDGTMDQEQPFDSLLQRIADRHSLACTSQTGIENRRSYPSERYTMHIECNSFGVDQVKQTLYGYDLSAATDRLPIDLQKDILNCMGLPGDSWAKLLDIQYYVPEKGFIRYECGQPMGAYSSFAMLAITHHVIVQIAAIKAGISETFTDYCVLGDDIVIANDAVAKEYLELMKTLGLEISLGKSVISTKFTEFAKRLRGCQYDISPIGPGLILQCLRNRYYICILVYELLRRGLLHVYEVFPKLLPSLPRVYHRYSKLIVGFVVLHIRTYKPGDHQKGGMLVLEHVHFISKEKVNSLLDMMWTTICKDARRLWHSVKDFLNRGIFVSQSRVGLPDGIEFLNLFVVPSTYTIIRQYLISFNEVTRKFGLYGGYSHELNQRDHVVNDIENIISHLERISIIDLDIQDREKVKMTLDTLYKLNEIIMDANKFSSLVKLIIYVKYINNGLLQPFEGMLHSRMRFNVGLTPPPRRI